MAHCLLVAGVDAFVMELGRLVAGGGPAWEEALVLESFLPDAQLQVAVVYWAVGRIAACEVAGVGMACCRMALWQEDGCAAE